MPRYTQQEGQVGGAGVVVRGIFALAAGGGFAYLAWEPAPPRVPPPTESEDLTKDTAVRQRIVTDDDALPRLEHAESRWADREEAWAGFDERWQSEVGRSTAERDRDLMNDGGTGEAETAALTVLPHSRGPP